MQRTETDRARRQAIADAASGRIQRARVVLYACLPSGEPDKVLNELRLYAAARDWIVADELIDRASITKPPAERPQWARLAELVEAGQAQGIVTPMRSMCGLHEPDRVRLGTWLAAHNAFVVDVWTVSSTSTMAARP